MSDRIIYSCPITMKKIDCLFMVKNHRSHSMVIVKWYNISKFDKILIAKYYCFD